MLNKQLKTKILFGLLMSGCMALLMSGIMTYINVGIDQFFLSHWMHAWIIAYPIAFISVLVFSPVITKIVNRLH